MAFLRASLVAIYAATAIVLATPTPFAPPIVKLDKGKFTGTTADGINKFLGIPFAEPPVGDLRFRLPQALDPYSGTYNATAFGLSCPQQATKMVIPDGLPQETNDFLKVGSQTSTPDGEDCLTLNVVAPAYAKRGSKLPVVVWIFGGGFEFGSANPYDGGVIVNRSIALNEPVVYVSMNYRVSAFGFLAGQEVKDAGVGNLGLHDQRLALHWVQKHIHTFGGDPSKVTIWGQSAGAISTSMQMLANGGDPEGLFRGAFMQSGSPTPIGDITQGQKYYDALVEGTGCSGSSDTLACLRAAPYETLKAAMDDTPSLYQYQSLAIAWQPRVDGVFLTDVPQKLVQQGKVANIPFVAGNCDDEGTIFSLPQLNVTTEAELRDYLAEFFLPDATAAEMDELLALYPQDVTQGSPYGTGSQYALSPQSKRIAALLGDFAFQAPRRFFLENVSDKQDTWAFLSKRLKSLPVVGSAHGSDVLDIYGYGELTDYLIHFATNMDPNCGSSPQWPKYTTSSRQLLTLLDGQAPNITLTQDTYRVDGMELISKLGLAYPQ